MDLVTYDTTRRLLQLLVNRRAFFNTRDKFQQTKNKVDRTNLRRPTRLLYHHRSNVDLHLGDNIQSTRNRHNGIMLCLRAFVEAGIFHDVVFTKR